MEDAIKEEEIIFGMVKEDACCPLEYEIPLRWGLPCSHWMDPAVFDKSLFHCRLYILAGFMMGQIIWKKHGI